MFARPRQLESEPSLYEAAIKVLMRRAHSVHEMKQSLQRRCSDESLVKKVLDRLKREGLIDDARYAKQFVRQRTEIRRQGRFRVARDLRARGVPDRHIDAALEKNSSETDEAAFIRHRIERKLKLLRGAIDQRKIASLYRGLLRAGFPGDAIRRELKSLIHEGLPEIESDPE